MRFNKNNISILVNGFNAINMAIPLVTFLFVCIVTYKALIYKNEVDTYEDYFITIENKDDYTVDYEYNAELVTDKFKDIQVNEYVNCLNQKLSSDNFSESLNITIRTLENLFNSSYNNFAFKYTDIYTGFTVGYNEKQEIFTASTIKAPMAIYLYEQAESGLVNLDEILTYTSRYYNTGSGILKTKSFNTNYTVRELVSYAIIPSDNAAHNMLMDRFGRANMYSFWNQKGTGSIFRYNTNWGYTTANDATIYMKELYDYYNTDTVLANELMGNFTNVSFKPLSGRNSSIVTANKSGWTGSVFHDAAIIFDNNPYILVVLSNTGLSGYTYLFNLTSKLVGELHNEYWNVKYNMCKQIIS